MKSLRFAVTVPGYLMGRALGKLTDAVVFGPLSGLSLIDVADPALPGPDWVRVEVLMSGICGSHIATFTFKSSPALEPFVSFPAVPGHEVLARVVEVGRSVTCVSVGDRTTVDPSISCAVRGRPPGPRAREALFATGARAYKPLVGPDVFSGGGFPLIFDCVGSRESLDQSLRFVAPRGTIVLLGCAGQIETLDLTFLWAREVRVAGFLCYGTESFRGEKLHTFEVTQRLLAETRAPIASLVTHRFPLAGYQEALRAAAHRSESGAMKVILTPQA